MHSLKESLIAALRTMRTPAANAVPVKAEPPAEPVPTIDCGTFTPPKPVKSVEAPPVHETEAQWNQRVRREAGMPPVTQWK